MAPCSDKHYLVNCDNGSEGNLTADAIGVTACLYAYSYLSFSNNVAFTGLFANNYHWLHAYMLEHQEASAILSAID